MSYEKLVRDKIPEIIRSNGEEPETRILSDEEYKKELEKKLLEEYQELLSERERLLKEEQELDQLLSNVNNSLKRENHAKELSISQS